MRWGALFLVLLASCIRGADAPAPGQMYIVSISFSDFGPSFFYRLINLEPVGSDVIVRYTRVARASYYCPGIAVRSANVRLHDTSVAALLGDSNPCSIQPGQLASAIRKYRRKAGVFETVSFGLIANCGARSLSLGLPISDSIDMDRLASAHPRMKELWDLPGKVVQRSFGTADVLADENAKGNDSALQREGAAFFTDLISGKYDAGLSLAAKGNVGTWKSPSFRGLLASYRGPLTTNEAEAGLVPQLTDANRYRFNRYVAPIYPPLAKMARVQGKVELQLSIDPTTGDVRDVSVISGPPLLKQAAIDAAKQWRFDPQSVAPTLDITLDFDLKC